MYANTFASQTLPHKILHVIADVHTSVVHRKGTVKPVKMAAHQHAENFPA